MNKENTEGFADEVNLLQQTLRKVLVTGLVLLVIGYFVSGIFFVRAGDTGVMKRFGRILDDRVPPGIHYHFPWPFESVQRVSTGEIRDREAGFGADEEKIGEFERLHGPLDSYEYSTLFIPYCLTGDRNIIHLKVIVQYQVTDPSDFLYRLKNVDEFIVRSVQQRILESVARMNVDFVLLTGKIPLQMRISEEVEKIIEKLQCGVRLVSVNIKRARAPRQVIASFKDVIDAQEERLTAIHDAENYQYQVIPEAKAQAATIVAKAESYRNEAIAKAKGKAERFELLLDEYEKNPKLLRRRLYVESIEDILSRVDKYIVDKTERGDIVDMGLIGTAQR